ncbi:hypothetical protein CEPID_06605 [Corynebacterium epidermidicanis]|uniref:Uncharacterized protein n=1 Tax=Corynebacterium epidermidicanis TaxID=1050174 RepID=A0A0G3GPW6_9CORY|nr:hypothetical protein CEPID_06605 [Corynebacterium epidermidicanis]
MGAVSLAVETFETHVDFEAVPALVGCGGMAPKWVPLRVTLPNRTTVLLSWTQTTTVLVDDNGSPPPARGHWTA